MGGYATRVNSDSDTALAALQADFPGWQVWTVNRYIGGLRWCATHTASGDHAEADEPAHLREYLAGRAAPDGDESHV